MSSPLSVRLKDPKELLSACKVALPSWSEVTLDNFSCCCLTGGDSSPGVYRVSCSIPGIAPATAVLKLESESNEDPHHEFNQVYRDI